MNKTQIITLLTDFGTSDAYVGVMKGVLLSICPAARLIDLTHTISPQNVRQAAYVLLTAYRYFPAETVFLVVVDPGVGTTRDPIAVATEHGTFVAPDNGVLSYVLDQVTVQAQVTLANPHYRRREVSTTFHGRDIFAPAAAYLANGIPLKRMGPPRNKLALLPAPSLEITQDGVRGEVLHTDHFGNVITSVGSLAWVGDDSLILTPQFGPQAGTTYHLTAASATVTINDHQLDGICRTYGTVEASEPTLLVGSSGQLEIAVNQGSAAQRFGAQPGDTVQVGGECRRADEQENGSDT